MPDGSLRDRSGEVADAIRDLRLDGLVGVGGDDVDRHHRVGPRRLRRGLEALPVHPQRLVQGVGREMRGEAVGQAESCRELRAIEAGAEDPEGHVRPRAGNGLDHLAGLHRPEQGLEFLHVLGEVV